MLALAESLELEAQASERRAVSLEAAAAELGVEAAALAGGLEPVRRRFGADVWVGPAADRAREEAAAAARRLGAAGDELQRVAALVRRRAGEHRSYAESLRRQAHAARAGAAAPSPATGGPGWRRGGFGRW